ncbi:MAG TPA: peptidylprolyl isomerase, partial [Ignavibacteriaceae bacterium]
QTWLNEKLQNYIFASITVNEDEIIRKFKDQYIYATALYALFDLNLFPDTLYKPTEEELEDFYQEHKEDYKVNETRKLKFVLFRNQASAADTSMVISTLESVKEITTSDTADFKSFVDIYSEVPYVLDTMKINEFTPQALEIIQKANSGDVVGPVPAPDGYTLFHLVNKVKSTEKLVKASHILINNGENEEANLKEANRIYQELINGADFVEYATKYSGDPGSAKNGGDLGWFGKGMMVKEFEETCFKAPLNVIQKPVKTTFGYHIIKVTGQSADAYVVEKIVNQVKQSAATRDEIYNSANDFSYLADKNGFEKEAETMKYNIQESQPFAEKSVSIPGLGASPNLIKFAFENGLNSISGVYKLAAGFVVAQISEVNPEGYRPVEEIKIELEQKYKTEKRFESARKLAEDLLGKINGDINKITGFDPRIVVRSAGRFNSQTSIPNIGNDKAFIRTALSMETDQLSQPVKGLRGYYLIKLTEKTTFDSTMYKTQSPTLRNSILQEKKNAYFNMWLKQIKDKAEIVDNRYLFYGY